MQALPPNLPSAAIIALNAEMQWANQLRKALQQAQAKIAVLEKVQAKQHKLPSEEYK